MDEEYVILGVYCDKSDATVVRNYVIMNAKWIIWKNRNNKKYSCFEFSADVLLKLLLQEYIQMAKVLRGITKISDNIKIILGRFDKFSV